MVDPNKIKDFLTRTAAAMKKSMESGDVESVSRYEAMIDRAIPLAERSVSQVPPQGAAQVQGPVIPWGKSDTTIPPIGGQTEQAASPTVFDNPFKAKQPKSPLLTMPGGQATPQVSKGPAPVGQAMQFPASGSSNDDRPLDHQWESLSAGEPMVNLPSAQDTWKYSKAGAKAGVLGPPMQALAWNAEMAKAIPDSALNLPGNILGLGDLVGKKADMPSSEPTSLPLQEGAVETQEPYVKQNAGLPEPELMDIVGQAEANPYDDVEAEAIKRIKAEAVDKPNPLMYLFTLLMMGAPRTFAMIMADQNRYSQSIRDIYNSVRRDKTDWERNKTAHSFRSREVQANEDRALAALARADNDKLRAQQGEQGKDLRTIMQAPLDPKDPLSARARELMMTRLPK